MYSITDTIIIPLGSGGGTTSGVPTYLVSAQPASPEQNSIYIYPDGDGNYQAHFWDGAVWHLIGDFSVAPNLSDYVTKTEAEATYAKVVDFNALVTIQKPKIFNYVDTNQFDLIETPAFIIDVWVLEGDASFHYLQDNDADYTVSGSVITINNPTLTSGMKVKVIYAA